MLGIGSLCFDYKDFSVTDGVIWYKVLWPSLLFRLLNKKPTRPCIYGVWFNWGRWIIWFMKKGYVFQYRAIKEEKNIAEIVKERLNNS